MSERFRITTARSLARTLLIAAAALAIAAAGAVGGAGLYASVFAEDAGTVVREVTVTSARQAAATGALSVSDIYDRASKGVVSITVSSNESTPSGGSQTQRAQASGFVYDDKGHVVTNQHVVDGAQSITVTFWNDAAYKATVVGADTSTDLAVIKIDAPASLLSPLVLGNSSALEVGEGVIAIGSPFGLAETVTTGIVSALHRQMTSPNNFTINDSIQTDAAINHGNSGGPLLNMNGQVIGANAQIESAAGGSDGVGFAIPSNTVASIARQLIATGSVEHAYLGVSIAEIPEAVASDLGTVPGVEVAEVKSGTPAAKAGLRAATGSSTVLGRDYPTGGDVITAIDGKPITAAAELQSAIDAKRPGDTIALTYSRSGTSRTVDVTLDRRPT